MPIPRPSIQPPPVPRIVYPTDPVRQSPAASDRLVGNEDNLGLEPDAQVDVWYDVLSTWLNRVRFSWRPVTGGPPTLLTEDPKQRTGYLQVEFLDLAVIMYTDPLPYGVFDDLVNSGSKGQYVWHGRSGLINRPYVTISGPRRKVTAAMRAAREPGRGGKNVRFTGGSKRPPK